MQGEQSRHRPRRYAMPIATVNPATGETVQTFDALGPEQIDAALARSVTGFDQLRAASYAQRAGGLRGAADILEREADTAAAMMTTEMGKTLAAARAEVLKCAAACR